MSWVLLLVTALLTAALFPGARSLIYYEGA
jgi:hypothetical protein